MHYFSYWIRYNICTLVILYTILWIQIKNTYANGNQETTYITLIYEELDDIVTSFIKHLNASISYENDHYGYDEDVITLESFVIPSEFSDYRVFDSLQNRSSFILSMAKSDRAKFAVRIFADRSKLPVIQIHLRPWNGIVDDSVGAVTGKSKQSRRENYTSNHVVIVPSFIVFDNMISELLPLLNITSGLTVVYDKYYDRFGMYDWRQPFELLPYKPKFELIPEANDGENWDVLIEKHVHSLKTAKQLMFYGVSTEVVERYLLVISNRLTPEETRRFYGLIVFSKDTFNLKCEECRDLNLFWIRMRQSPRGESLRTFAEFLRQEELDIDMNYHIKTYDEPQISYCLDLISIAYKYLMETDAALARLTRDEVRKQRISNSTHSITLRGLMMHLISQPREFGNYDLHFGNIYYQVTSGMIFRVEHIPSESDSYLYKYIGNWSILDGVEPLYDTLGTNIRALQHYRIVTIIFQQEPFVQYKNVKEASRSAGGNSADTVRRADHIFEGYCIDLLQFLQQDLNFTYDLYVIEDNRFGSVDENGNWNGMIGALTTGVAEIALGPVSVLAERENDIDFTVPFYDLVGTTILMKRNDVEYSLFKFLKVLEWPVWCCIFGAYIFTSVLLYIFDRYSPYSYTNNREKYINDLEKREFTLKECFWFCMTSLTPQGGGEAPKNVSGRLVAATWWLFGFIIIASYTANLAAFLTVSRMEQPINTIDDLAKQYKIEYSPIKGGATETYFRRMAEIEEQFYNIWKQMSLNESLNSRDRAKLAVWDYPVSDKFTNMWRFMQESGLPSSVEEAIERVLTSKKGYAFIGDAMEIKYAILTNCKLQQIGTEFSRKPYAIATQTAHPLKDQISVSILKLLNERKLETLKERWWHQNPKRHDCPTTEDDSTGISINNIGGVFIVILAGIAISLAILAFEYLYYTQRNSALRDPMVDGDDMRHSGDSYSADMKGMEDLAITRTSSRLSSTASGVNVSAGRSIDFYRQQHRSRAPSVAHSVLSSRGQSSHSNRSHRSASTADVGVRRSIVNPPPPSPPRPNPMNGAPPLRNGGNITYYSNSAFSYH